MSQYQHILNALECADQHDYETAQSAALAIRALELELAEARKELAETQEVSQAVCDLREDLSDARDVIDVLRGELAEARDALKAIWLYINNHDGRSRG